MSYSTVAQLRAKLKQITTAIQDDTKIESNISDADDEIKSDLSGYIDFSLVPLNSTDSNFPIFLNLLSRYKTCEISLIYSYSAKRETTQIDDISYYSEKYMNLIDRVKNGEIPLLLNDGTSIAGDIGASFNFSNAMGTIKPYFGTDKYGEFEDEDEKENNEERG